MPLPIHRFAAVVAAAHAAPAAGLAPAAPPAPAAEPAPALAPASAPVRAPVPATGAPPSGIFATPPSVVAKPLAPHNDPEYDADLTELIIASDAPGVAMVGDAMATHFGTDLVTLEQLSTEHVTIQGADHIERTVTIGRTKLGAERDLAAAAFRDVLMAPNNPVGATMACAPSRAYTALRRLFEVLPVVADLDEVVEVPATSALKTPAKKTGGSRPTEPMTPAEEYLKMAEAADKQKRRAREMLMEDIQNRTKTGELDKIKVKYGRAAPDLTDLCSLSQLKMLKVHIVEEGMIPYDDAVMPGKLKRLHGANGLRHGKAKVATDADNAEAVAAEVQAVAAVASAGEYTRQIEIFVHSIGVVAGDADDYRTYEAALDMLAVVRKAEALNTTGALIAAFEAAMDVGRTAVNVDGTANVAEGFELAAKDLDDSNRARRKRKRELEFNPPPGKGPVDAPDKKVATVPHEASPTGGTAIGGTTLTPDQFARLEKLMAGNGRDVGGKGGGKGGGPRKEVTLASGKKAHFKVVAGGNKMCPVHCSGRGHKGPEDCELNHTNLKA